MRHCVSAPERSYLGPLNGATFRAEPEQSQIGISDQAFTMSLSFSDIWYDQLEHLLLHQSHDGPVCEYSQSKWG